MINVQLLRDLKMPRRCFITCVYALQGLSLLVCKILGLDSGDTLFLGPLNSQIVTARDTVSERPLEKHGVREGLDGALVSA